MRKALLLLLFLQLIASISVLYGRLVYKGFNYVCWERNGFPYSWKWKTADSPGNKAFIALRQSSINSCSGNGALEIDVRLIGDDYDYSSGEIFVDLVNNPPRGNPPACLETPVNVIGGKILTSIFIPNGLQGGPYPNYNYVQLTIQDVGGHTFCSDPFAIEDVDEWTQLNWDLSQVGQWPPDFDPTQVVRVGLKLSANENWHGSYEGHIWIDDYTIMTMFGSFFNIYTFDETKNSLEALVEYTNSNYLAIITTWFVDDIHSNIIYPDEDMTPSDESLIQTIDYAHNLGLKVMLKPFVDVKDGTWRALIAPSDINEWFESYRDFILHYAQIAVDHGVESFCLGTELTNLDTTSEYASYWLGLIEDVRAIYPNKITYAANWDSYNKLTFANALDVIGINAYFPLCPDENDPDIDDILHAWPPIVEDIRSFHISTGKNIIFTEIGYASRENANAEPWRGCIGSQSCEFDYNCALQERLYRAVFYTFMDSLWFDGLFWWSWSIIPDAGGCCDRNLTPQGKLAQQTVKEFFTTAPVCRPVDVVLCIDRSGSMGASGYIEPAKTAASTFVGLMQMGDQIGVVSFSNNATVNFPLTLIQSEQDKQNAQNAISSIYSGGYTSIGAGLQASQQQLLEFGRENFPWAIILLSDGYENTPPMVSEVLPEIINSPTVVYTIALGPNSDQELLNNIAIQTGGTYHFSPGPQQLQCLYYTIRGQLLNQQIITSHTGTSYPGVTDYISDIPIDGSISQSTFSLSWAGSDIDLTLRKPDGTTITPDSAEENPNVIFVSGTTYEYYVIDYPQPGLWEMQITGVQVPQNGETYTASVMAISDLTLDVEFEPSTFYAGNPILVRAVLRQMELPVVGANLTAVIETPGELYTNSDDSGFREELYYPSQDETYHQIISPLILNQYTLTLYDDGLHGDDESDDGIYANYFYETESVGSYTFNVTATGVSLTGEPFSREASRSIYISEPIYNYDVYITNNDIFSVPSNPLCGDTAIICAIVHVDSLSDSISSLLVRFYDGHPDSSGTTQIGCDIILHSLQAGSIETLCVEWFYSDTLTHLIYVALDPEDSLPETNEANNIGYLCIQPTLIVPNNYWKLRMFSLPVETADPTVHGIIEDDLGRWPGEGWYVFWWNGYKYLSYGFSPEFPETLRIGNAYFFFSMFDATFDITGTPIPTDDYYLIPLFKGFTQIGDPYVFNVNWRNVRVLYNGDTLSIDESDSLGIVSNLLWYWHPDSGYIIYQSPDGILKPTEGYWVFSKVENAYLLIPAESSVSVEKVTQQSHKDEWIADISVFATNAADKGNFIGLLSDALNGYGKYDVDEIEFIVPLNSLYKLMNTTREKSSTKLAGNLSKTLTKKPQITAYFVEDEHLLTRDIKNVESVSQRPLSWTFEVRCINLENEDVTIKFTERVTTKDYSVYLYDPDRDELIDLGEQKQYTFHVESDSCTHRFKLTVTKQEESSPTEFLLLQNQPNPFHDRTQIVYSIPIECLVELKVYDVTGRLVKTLISETQKPGIHKIVWDGTSNSGRKVPSGVYFYSIKAGEFKSTKSMLLIK